MNHIFRFTTTSTGRRFVAFVLALASLGFSSISWAQQGHDHAEEAEHGESHEAHAVHDGHAEEGEEHDHAEDAAHGESHEAHAEHDEHVEEGGDGEHAHGGSIELDPRDMDDFGIEIGTAGPGIIREELRVPGEVRMNENAMGHVTPRFDGVVSAIHYRLGDSVKAGDVLAELESNETLRPFDLKALIDGTVVAFNVTLGESMAAGEVAYTISDTSTVWVDLRVYQRDLPKVRRGQTVRITAGHEYPTVQGKISYVGPVVDETSRTGLARAVVQNPKNLFRPGLFVIGNLLLDEYELPVVVSRSAVHAMEGRDVIFVEASDAEGFEPRPVRVGRRDSENLEILEGLKQGERYITQGGFFLKADLQKESFGDGHAH